MSKKVLTPSDALAAYERAFRLGSPQEVEQLLREMLNVQVAVVDDKETAEAQLRKGKRLKTVSVPYDVFLRKRKGKTVYRLDPTAQRSGQEFLVEAGYDDIAPNRTYVLLSHEAGYHPDKGLTFEGQGQPTGFEDIPDAEHREKRTEGRFQTWREHTQGVWERSQRIVDLYRPFVERWAENALGLKDASKTDFVDTVLWAMRVAVLFHDIGKLNQKWQDIVWENEQKIWKFNEQKISNQPHTDFIARTSPVPDEQVRSQLQKPPYHAPFAYPFVKTFLRKILGNYRFLDTIALAAARHHSLEVSGAIKDNEFQWAQLGNQSAPQCLNQLVQTVFGSLSEEERHKLEKALQEAASALTQSSEADEPPGPTDDFYFLYCLTNRLVKVCDWEDAGGTQIELRMAMGLPKPLALQKETFYVYKTGLPFYDAARLIGVAHLFFGTASAEVEDKGSYWEVRGPSVTRDRRQIEWVIEEGKEKSHDLSQKHKQIQEALDDVLNNKTNDFRGLPESKDGYPALKEFDAALQYGPRGIDPLKDAVVVSSQGTKPKKQEKVYQLSAHDLVSASLGFSFSARALSGEQRSYILPVFREKFVLSGTLTYLRDFNHSAGGFVSEVFAALSVLIDLVGTKLPVSDFVYTRIFGRNVFSSSGYLGLERLCSYWWRRVVEEDNSNALRLLKEFRLFLAKTASSTTYNQVQDLARWVADFVANPNVDALVKIQQLKARIMAASQGQRIQGGCQARQLLNRSQSLEEVKEMMAMQLPEVPWQVSEALAKALRFDEKGWMNQFTRLENAGTFSQFIQQVERIISRGYYREQQESGQNPDIRQALTRARDIAEELRKIESQLQDDRSFRAWKAIFLLDVLSRVRFRKESAPESEEAFASEEASESKTEEG